MNLDDALARLLLRLPNRNRPPVLTYHHVGERIPGEDPGLSISVRSFERQLDWLVRQGFVGITASTWLDAVRGRVKLPRRPLLITFDDGYLELREHALPLLRERGFAATVFVVTGQIGAVSAWADQAEARRPLLGRDEIRAWAADEIEFGSHTRTHARLTRLDPSAWPEELEGSRHDLAALLGKPPRSFAYPYGAVNDEVRRSVARVFELAFTVDAGANGPKRDLHLLQRSGVLEEDSLADLALRLRVGWTPRHRIRLRVRRRIGRARRRLVGGS